MKTLPGQILFSSQFWKFSLIPKQSCPPLPGYGSLQFRSRTFMPFPQVWEQEVKFCHALHLPST